MVRSYLMGTPVLSRYGRTCTVRIVLEYRAHFSFMSRFVPESFSSTGTLRTAVVRTYLCGTFVLKGYARTVEVRSYYHGTFRTGRPSFLLIHGEYEPKSFSLTGTFRTVGVRTYLCGTFVLHGTPVLWRYVRTRTVRCMPFYLQNVSLYWVRFVLLRYGRTITIRIVLRDRASFSFMVSMCPSHSPRRVRFVLLRYARTCVVRSYLTGTPVLSRYGRTITVRSVLGDRASFSFMVSMSPSHSP